jgi:Flp pilus assembly secretin CpaC
MKSIVSATFIAIVSIGIAKAETVYIEKDCHKVVIDNPNVVDSNKLYEKDYILIVGDSVKETNYFSFTCLKSIFKQGKEEVSNAYNGLITKE